MNQGRSHLVLVIGAAEGMPQGVERHSAGTVVAVVADLFASAGQTALIGSALPVF
jgi:hypothetical protein